MVADTRTCLWILGGVFVAAGGAVVWFFSISPLIQCARAQSWVEIPCVIDSSRLETREHEDGDTYIPYIHYSYAFEDGDYESDRYTFIDGSYSGYDHHRAIVDRYPGGSNAVCYVNPNAPEESVLSRDPDAEYFFGFLGLIVVGMGGIAIVIGALQHRT